jgi:hypothetical protein
MKKFLFMAILIVASIAPTTAQPDSEKISPSKVEKRLKQFILLSPISTFQPFITIDLVHVDYYSKATRETTLVGIDGKEIEIVITYEEFDRLMKKVAI